MEDEIWINIFASLVDYKRFELIVIQWINRFMFNDDYLEKVNCKGVN